MASPGRREDLDKFTRERLENMAKIKAKQEELKLVQLQAVLKNPKPVDAQPRRKKSVPREKPEKIVSSRELRVKKEVNYTGQGVIEDDDEARDSTYSRKKKGFKKRSRSRSPGTKATRPKKEVEASKEWPASKGMAGPAAEQAARNDAWDLVNKIRASNDEAVISNPNKMTRSKVSGGFWLSVEAKFNRKVKEAGLQPGHILLACDERWPMVVAAEEEEGEEEAGKKKKQKRKGGSNQGGSAGGGSTTTIISVPTWTVVWMHKRSGLSGGWRAFATDHDLYPNDYVVFQYMAPRLLRVYFFRASHYEEPFNGVKPAAHKELSDMHDGGYRAVREGKQFKYPRYRPGKGGRSADSNDEPDALHPRHGTPDLAVLQPRYKISAADIDESAEPILDPGVLLAAGQQDIDNYTPAALPPVLPAAPGGGGAAGGVAGKTSGAGAAADSSITLTAAAEEGADGSDTDDGGDSKKKQGRGKPPAAVASRVAKKTRRTAAVEKVQQQQQQQPIAAAKAKAVKAGAPALNMALFRAVRTR